MEEKYKSIAAELGPGLEKMRKEMPGVMNGFGMMVQSGTQDGALSQKTKELIALALGIAAHCDGCIAHHMHALVALGVTKGEIAETLGVAVFMGGGPSVMYAMAALKAFEEFSAK